MPVEWSQESFKVKEETKWDRPKRLGGMNRDGHEEFPKMLYKAQPHPRSGKYETSMARDIVSLDKTVVEVDAEQFNRSCQLVVNDEREYGMARADGWSDSRADAMAFYEGLQQDIAKAASERNYDDRRMSEKARAEAGTADASTARHVAEIPQKPADPVLKAKRQAGMAKAREAKAAKKAASVV